MKNKNRLPLVFSLIAVILSFISLYLVLRPNASFITRDELNQDLATAWTALQTEDFAKFQNDLVFYQNCMNTAIKNYGACIEFKQGNCSANFDDAKSICNANSNFR